MPTPIDTLPDEVRRWLAYRATLEALGFAPGQIFLMATAAPIVHDLPPDLTIWVARAEPPSPAPVWFLALISLAGRVNDTNAVIVVAQLPPEEWERLGAGAVDAAIEAWNGLTQEERTAERLRWVPFEDFWALGSDLWVRGLGPPRIPSRPARN